MRSQQGFGPSPPSPPDDRKALVGPGVTATALIRKPARSLMRQVPQPDDLHHRSATSGKLRARKSATPGGRRARSTTSPCPSHSDDRPHRDPDAGNDDGRCGEHRQASGQPQDEHLSRQRGGVGALRAPAVEPIARGDEKQTRANESGGHASAVRHDEHGAEPGTAQGDAPEQHQQG